MVMSMLIMPINIMPCTNSLTLIFVDLEDHDEQDSHRYHEDFNDHDQGRTLYSDRDLEEYLDDNAGVGE